MNNDEYFMSLALKEAKVAYSIDEVPIGCVIVSDNKVIAKAHNTRDHKQTVIGHAEINAIRKVNKQRKSWRIPDCDIYITLEPCIMCAGAIIQSRFRRVIFGANDPKGGAFGSSIDVINSPNLNHYPEIIKGVLEKECSSLISNYFKEKRKKE